ncbi:1-aminocyclopropane-1-carboxylate oxidase-like protein 2 [Nymphaea thermarum]|nr:1-aminocyclopropane-1-carboxylate oxidase-like protein 2 [Nymphaea thermarum]
MERPLHVVPEKVSASALVTGVTPDFDLDIELKAFHETKAGVKGLLDSNISTIPRIFIDPLDDHPLLSSSGHAKDGTVVPVIDFSNVGSRRRKEMVAQVRDALKKWGVFQVVNHGIPVATLEEMISGAFKFHESPTEGKQKFYSRDLKKEVGFASTFDLYSRKRANWRDTFRCHMAPDPPSPHEEIVPEYSKCVAELGETIAKILAEALGLPLNYFINMEWLKTQSIGMHYYPACPQPELTRSNQAY